MRLYGDGHDVHHFERHGRRVHVRVQGEKNHIGLSIDTGLFSEEENLVCRLGDDSLTENVYRFSSFYNGLHINPNS